MTVASAPISWKLLAAPLAGLDDPEDACVVRLVGAGIRAVLIDPVAHGGPGAIVRTRAIAALPGNPVTLFKRLHGSLEGTAGASVAALEVAPAGDLVAFAGVGRIHGYVVGAAVARLESRAGLLGVGHAVAPRSIEAGWGPGSWAVLASDGLLESWHLERLRLDGNLSLDELVDRMRRLNPRLPDDASALLIAAGT